MSNSALLSSSTPCSLVRRLSAAEMSANVRCRRVFSSAPRRCASHSSQTAADGKETLQLPAGGAGARRSWSVSFPSAPSPKLISSDAPPTSPSLPATAVSARSEISPEFGSPATPASSFVSQNASVRREPSSCRLR